MKRELEEPKNAAVKEPDTKQPIVAAAPLTASAAAAVPEVKAESAPASNVAVPAPAHVEEAKVSAADAEKLKRDRSKKKQKLILIMGYNGLKFIGSQKQPGTLRTVEGELEKALYAVGFIADSNYGTLQKISFSRATRTDKRVHALQNFFACKCLVDPHVKDLNVHRERLTAVLPPDMKLFSVLEGSKRFNSKLRCSAREYLYYLPSFCLAKGAGKKKTEELYKYRLSEEDVKNVQELCQQFKGTHKFHNYTKYMDPKMMQANRHIFEIAAKVSFVMSGIEFVEFFIKGQSFLYNQIRKMIGMVIQVRRKGESATVIEESFKRDRVVTPMAPGEGLMLNRVCYDKYNEIMCGIKGNVELPKKDMEEIDKFKSELVKCICKQEVVTQV